MLPRLLSALLEPGAEQLQLIVVCNGCKDRTADVARACGRAVEVIETGVPSKPNALNLGDQAALHFPRIYVDADVIIDRASISRLIQALSRPGVMAAAPLPEVDLTTCSSAVRRFYRADAMMPSHAGGIGGSGVYALSAAGRARFEQFPDVIADDAFVRRHFDHGERVAVQDARSVVVPPSRLRGLIAIKTRSHYGNMELGFQFPHLATRGRAGNATKLLRLALRPWWWAGVGTYLFVKLAARIRARGQFRRSRSRGCVRVWERDDTSRRASAVVA